MKQLLPVGTKVEKKSHKPFKSTFKVNTIKGYVMHPKLFDCVCYTFEEDDSFVVANICQKVN